MDNNTNNWKDFTLGNPQEEQPRRVAKRSKRKPLLALLREQAVEMQESGKRSHYSNYETLLRRHFSKNAFFFTPEAVGFFYQPNTLGISDKPFVYLLPRGTLRERELFKSTTF